MEELNTPIDYYAANYGHRPKELQYLDAYRKAKSEGMKFYMESCYIGGIGSLRFYKNRKGKKLPIDHLLKSVKEVQTDIFNKYTAISMELQNGI